MSIRIKLPAAKAIDSEANQEPFFSEPPTRRRKSTKRRLAVVSDEEYDDDKQSNNSPQITTPRGRSRTLEADSELDVDHNIPLEAHPAPEPSTSRPRKQIRKTAGSGPPPNKKKRLNKAHDSDGDYTHAIESNNEEEETLAEDKSQSKTTNRSKSREEKVRSIVDGETLKKEQTGSHGLSQAKRPRITPKTESTTASAGEEGGIKPDTHNVSHPQSNEPPLLPPKRKLPTIRKNKGAVPASATAAPSKASATTATVRNEPLDIAEASKPPPIGARKTPASLGNADFDLRNPSVYTALFKPAGGNTPRSGLNRREKDDERRKELNKMRDEARAKRLAEMASSFDLQAQTDKILRFEERLKSNRSSAIYPNFLGAKWRELWERDRRRPKEQGWSEGRATWGEPGEREEGEMNEQPT